MDAGGNNLSHFSFFFFFFWIIEMFQKTSCVQSLCRLLIILLLVFLVAELHSTGSTSALVPEPTKPAERPGPTSSRMRKPRLSWASDTSTAACGSLKPKEIGILLIIQDSNLDASRDNVWMWGSTLDSSAPPPTTFLVKCQTLKPVLQLMQN